MADNENTAISKCNLSFSPRETVSCLHLPSTSQLESLMCPSLGLAHPVGMTEKNEVGGGGDDDKHIII